MPRRHARPVAIFSAATMLTAVGVVGLQSQSASAADKVIVFYTQCDEMSPTATVKVKRINEDGTEAVTIGDTGIAHCSDTGAPDVFHTGFAVSGAYGYFGWSKSDNSASGVGRIKLDGSAAAERNFATIPAPAKYLQLSPRSIGGYVFGYVDDGPASEYGVSNPRVVKIATSDGAVSVAYQPTAANPSFPVLYMSFGVGKDALYVSTNEMQNQKLTKVPLTGPANTSFFNFADVMSDFAISTEFFNGGGANLVAESDDTLFLYTRSLVTYKAGISTVQTSDPLNTFNQFGAVPGDKEGIPSADFPVWGGNFLYFKNGDSKHISRTTKTGAVENNVFPSIVKPGWVHHISPALASTVTVTTSTIPSTTVKSVTATTKPTAAPTVPKKGGLAPTAIASFLKVTVPKGAKLGLSVASASKKVCAVKSSKLVALKSGNCRVTLSVTPKAGKSTKKSVTLKTS